MAPLTLHTFFSQYLRCLETIQLFTFTFLVSNDLHFCSFLKLKNHISYTEIRYFILNLNTSNLHLHTLFVSPHVVVTRQ